MKKTPTFILKKIIFPEFPLQLMEKSKSLQAVIPQWAMDTVLFPGRNSRFRKKQHFFFKDELLETSCSVKKPCLTTQNQGSLLRLVMIHQPVWTFTPSDRNGSISLPAQYISLKIICKRQQVICVFRFRYVFSEAGRRVCENVNRKHILDTGSAYRQHCCFLHFKIK